MGGTDGEPWPTRARASHDHCAFDTRERIVCSITADKSTNGTGAGGNGKSEAPRGKKLLRLADALSTSVAYLVGLDPDADVPEEYLQEDQGALGLLAGDEEALLRAYRRLDVSSKAALLQIARKMAPEPASLEAKARRPPSRR